MTTLDEIQAVALTANLPVNDRTKNVPRARDQTVAVNVPKMLRALRGVERIHKKEPCCGSADCTGTVVCEGCQNYWPCPTILLIQEALR